MSTDENEYKFDLEVVQLLSERAALNDELAQQHEQSAAQRKLRKKLESDLLKLQAGFTPFRKRRRDLKKQSAKFNERLAEGRRYTAHYNKEMSTYHGGDPYYLERLRIHYKDFWKTGDGSPKGGHPGPPI